MAKSRKPQQRKRAPQPRQRAARRRKSSVDWQFPMKRQNFIIAGIGLAVIIIGFLLMSTGITEEPAVIDGKWNNPWAIAVAPVLLIIGYVIIIPYAIMKFFRNGENTE